MTNRAVLAVTAAIAAVGALDAALGGGWDLFAVFVLVALLQLVLLLRLSSRRPTVSMRADLVRWIRDRAEAEGESPERLVDRAVSSYRDGLAGGRVTAVEAPERPRDRER